MYIIYYHCSDLKGHGVFKNTEIKACTLLYLLQAIDQCVAVHVELARSLGNIEIILKKPIDRGSRIFVKGFRNLFPKYLFQKIFTQRKRETVDKPPDPKFIIRENRLL